MMFSRRRLLAVVSGLAIAGHDGLQVHAATNPQGAVNLMPDFWRVMDATAGMARSARASRLVTDFIEPHRQVFDHAGLTTLEAPRIERWLEKIEPDLGGIRRLEADLGATWARNRRLFRQNFPDFDPAASPVYFMPSFLAFDAHLEPHDGVLPLYVGLDGVVRYHGANADLAVLLSHELFHCYHAQRAPEMCLDPAPALYGGLWIEGLATYASERLNPSASRLTILLDDEPLAETGAAYVPMMAKVLLERLESRDEADQQAFFGAGYVGEWPARGGYLVGLLAARDIGKTMNLRDMAGLPPEASKAALVPRLRALSS